MAGARPEPPELAFSGFSFFAARDPSSTAEPQPVRRSLGAGGRTQRLPATHNPQLATAVRPSLSSSTYKGWVVSEKRAGGAFFGRKPRRGKVLRRRFFYGGGAEKCRETSLVSGVKNNTFGRKRNTISGFLCYSALGRPRRPPGGASRGGGRRIRMAPVPGP